MMKKNFFLVFFLLFLVPILSMAESHKYVAEGNIPDLGVIEGDYYTVTSENHQRDLIFENLFNTFYCSADGGMAGLYDGWFFKSYVINGRGEKFNIRIEMSDQTPRPYRYRIKGVIFQKVD